MGAPKKQRRKYSIPKKPYDRTRLERERKIKGSFGLRRKKEIWKAESMLRSFRERARELQAKSDPNKEKLLFDRIHRMGISCSNLEDVLEIGLEDILGRRLQTILHKKGLANSPLQARQFIVHGHALISGKKILWPSYIVSPQEEETISLDPKITSNIIMAEKKEETQQPQRKERRNNNERQRPSGRRDNRSNAGGRK